MEYKNLPSDKTFPLFIGLDVDKSQEKLKVHIVPGNSDRVNGKGIKKELNTDIQKQLLNVAKGVCQAVMNDPALAAKLGGEVAEELQKQGIDYSTIEELRHRIRFDKAIKYNKKRTNPKIRIATVDGKRVDGFEEEK